MKGRCDACGDWVEVNKPKSTCIAAHPCLEKGEICMTDVQKMFVLLAEIRQCINDDNLMAAQRKVMAIETMLKAQPLAASLDEETPAKCPKCGESEGFPHHPFGQCSAAALVERTPGETS